MNDSFIYSIFHERHYQAHICFSGASPNLGPSCCERIEGHSSVNSLVHEQTLADTPLLQYYAYQSKIVRQYPIFWTSTEDLLHPYGEESHSSVQEQDPNGLTIDASRNLTATSTSLCKDQTTRTTQSINMLSYFLVSILAVALVSLEPVNGQQTSAPSACPKPECCEDDCCGEGTMWSVPLGLCVDSPGNSGYDGSYASGYTEGCAYRACCEEDCCDPPTMYNPSTGFCEPGGGGPSGSISGCVGGDLDNDDVCDIALTNVPIKLLDAAGNLVATSATDSNGCYAFFDLPAGTYTVMETNIRAFPFDVSDIDGANDNMILTTIGTGGAPLNSTGNDFCDEESRTVSGTVVEDTDNDNLGDSTLSGVTLTLVDASGVPFETTVTDSSGGYIFLDVSPGPWTIALSPFPGYLSIGDSDGGDPDSTAVDVSSSDSSGNYFTCVAV